jgi:hypothetical protein
VNQTTDKIYIANANNSAATFVGVVTVIDGSTNSLTTVSDPNAQFPDAVAVNETANAIYVTNGGCGPGPGNGCSNPGSNPGSITTIGGASNSLTTIIDPNANSPEAVAVDPVTNHIYVANTGTGNLTVIDGGSFPLRHTLGVLLAGTGSGTVTSVPLGIDCGTMCEENVAAGADVSLTTVASSGSTFAHWSGPCSGTGSCDVRMDTDQFVTAAFNSLQVAVPNVVGEPQAAGTAAITGAGLVVGTVTQQSSDAVASGDIISESPAASTNVSSGSAVDLVISTGAANGGGAGGSGGGGGGGGIDVLTLGALLGSLLLTLRRSDVTARLLMHGG